MAKILNRERDGGMCRFERRVNAIEKCAFDNLKFGFRRARGEKRLTQIRSSLAAPEFGDRSIGGLQLAGGQAEKWKCAARPETYAGGGALLVSVDDVKPGM